MRLRALLWASLAVNAGLATMLIVVNRDVQDADGPLSHIQAAENRKSPPPQVIVRREPFTWRDIEAEDYRAYISNLRKIGCPEATIRDIIVADVNHSFAQRRQTEVITYEQEWWRQDPVVDYAGLTSRRAQQLESERRALLYDLLGTGWDADAMPPVPELEIREQFLATITPEQRAALTEAFHRNRAALAQLQPGVAAERLELERARLAQSLRQELAQIFTPDQVEAALVRYSELASTMRRELAGFEPTREEFLTIFRARQQPKKKLH